MAKFCTECGSDVIENYKFCPQCGAEIIHPHKSEHWGKKQTTQVGSHTDDVSNIIACDNCGEENSADNSLCESCGVKLKGSISHTISTKDKSRRDKPELKKTTPSSNHHKYKSKQRKHKANKNTEVKKEKEFDSKKIFIIATVITLFIIVTILSTGVLDSGVSTVPNNIKNSQSTGSGIDLNNVQLMNELESKLAANPDDSETLLKLAHLKNDSGFYDKAIPLYQRYLEQFPSNADARIDMGVCMFNLGDYDNAIKEMKKALEYEPNHQIGHLNLGVVNLTAGNVDEAKRWFQKAIDLGPGTDIGKRAKDLLNSHN